MLFFMRRRSFWKKKLLFDALFEIAFIYFAHNKKKKKFACFQLWLDAGAYDFILNLQREINNNV